MANEKYKIKGNNKVKEYDSEIEIEVDDQYEAYSKPIPEDKTPIPGGGGDITWFNNFGVRKKSNKEKGDVTYTVTLNALPEGKRLFVFYDNQAHEQPTEPVGSSGKIRFSLNIGDPPTGAGP